MRAALIVLLGVAATGCVPLIHENTTVHQVRAKLQDPGLIVAKATITYKEGLTTPFVVHSTAKCLVGSEWKISRETAATVSRAVESNEKVTLEFTYMGIDAAKDANKCRLMMYSLQGVEGFVQTQYRKNVIDEVCYYPKEGRISRQQCR